MRAHRFLAIFLLVSLTAVPGLAQIRIVPEAANMIPGDRVFQLLDSHGQEIIADNWSTSDPASMEISVRDGRTVVTFKAAGQFTVTATSSGRSATAQVTVLESFSEAQQRVPWVFSPIYSSFGNVLHAWAPDPDGANYFYEDHGASTSMIRAIREDGIQLWAWPAPGSSEVPKLLCGNMSNGVLLSLGKAAERVLVMLDGNGKELWRHPAPGFNGAITFNLGGSFFIVEDDLPGTSSRVVGFDPETGTQRFSLDLPASRQLFRNLEQTKSGLICSPGKESTQLLPIRHSNLQTGIDSIAHMSFTVMEVMADGGNCIAGKPVAADAITLKYSQKLQRLNLHEDGGYNFDLLETNRAEGPAGKTSATVVTPSGDIIPDYTGDGNFIAVRKTAVHWPNMSPGIAAEFEYRVSAEGELTDRFQMPSTLRQQHSVMLLGEENKVGLTARGKWLVAFETKTGKMLWNWQAQTDDTYPLAALADGGVIVKDGPYYLIVNSGGKVRTVLPPGFLEFYMHWNDTSEQP